jgi:hypothetical protein
MRPQIELALFQDSCLVEYDAVKSSIYSSTLGMNVLALRLLQLVLRNVGEHLPRHWISYPEGQSDIQI